MKNMIRMCLFIVVVAGLAFGAVTYIRAAHGEHASPRSSAAMPSQVERSEDANGSLVSYHMVAGEPCVDSFGSKKARWRRSVMAL